MFFVIPFKFKYIKKVFRNKNFTLLDVGAGNHSAKQAKKYFPNCIYHGIDIVDDYNNNMSDISVMDRFFNIDLTNLDYNSIPDNYYDVIVLAHVIEHLYNGEDVIKKLLPKLKKGGILYLEYPSFRSVNFPHKINSLNFHDDPSHCRFYSLVDLYNILVQNNCKILKGGLRRDFIRIILFPTIALRSIFRFGCVEGPCFWDIYGFSEFIISKKS